MRQYIVWLAVLVMIAAATVADAGVIKYTARHVVVPVAKAAGAVVKTAAKVAY